MDWGSAWWAGLTLFEKALWMIAVPSTLLTIVQLALLIMGYGGHDVDSSGGDVHFDVHTGDQDAHAEHGGGMHLFTVRGVIFFFTAFSWLGIVGLRTGLSIALATGLGLISGLAFMFALAWAMSQMSRLEESGNFEIKNALYKHGQVYLRVPEKRIAPGKIMVNAQGALRELHAVTDGEAIPTGAAVQVIDIVDPETVLVAKE